MPKLINPLDDPNFDPGAVSTAAPKAGGLVNPFDDPSFDPGAVPEVQKAPLSSGEEFLSATGAALKGEFQPMGQFMSGENRMSEDVPRFQGSGLSEGAKAQIALGTMTTTDPEKLADIVRSADPSLQVEVDRFGNVVIDSGQERGYLNRPGFSGQDIAEITGQVLQFVPAARIAGAMKSFLPRVFVAGSGEAATEATRQVATQALGSEQDISGAEVALAGVGGAGGEALAPVVSFLGRQGGDVVRRFLGSPDLVTPDGQITQKGATVLQQMGFNPEEASAALAQEAGRVARQGVGPQTAQAAAEAGEFGIPLTRGQATGDIPALQAEEAFRAGSRGTGAQRVQTGFDVQQQQAIQRASEGLVEGAGGPAIQRPVQAGEGALEGVRLRAETLDQEISDAYDLAGTLDASFEDDALTELPGFVSSVLGSADVDLDATLTPAAKRAFDIVGELAAKEGQTLKDFERFRRRVNFTIGAAANPSDKRAATIVKRAMDQWADAAVDDALIEGGQEALEAIKNARGLRQRYGQLFEQNAKLRNDRAGKIIERFVEDDITPEEAINHIIGTSQVGGTNTAALVAQRVKDIVGPESAEWGQIRQAALLRLFRMSEGKAPSPRMIAKSIKNATEIKGESFMKVMFTPKEIAQIKRFGRAVQNADRRADLGNPSKSGFTFFREMKAVLPFVATAVNGPVGAAVTVGTMGGKSLFSSAEARKNISQQFVDRVPTRGAAAVGGLAGQTQTQEQQ